MAKRFCTLIRALAENITEIDVLARLFVRNNVSNRKLKDLSKGVGLLTKKVTGVPYEQAARLAIELRSRKVRKGGIKVRRLREWIATDARLDTR